MTTESDSSKSEMKRKKIKLLIWSSVIIFLIALTIFLWWIVYGRFHNTTQDAYVHGNQVRLTPQIPGIVVTINGEDTDLVEEGQILVELDKTDRLIAFEESKAVLGETIRKVTQMFEKVYALAAEYEVKEAQLARYEIDYLDRKQVVETGAISDEEFVHAEAAYLSAKSALKAVRYELMQAISQVKNTTVSSHPLVLKAVENVKYSWVNLQRCTLRAPATGVIAQRRVQVGESVAPNLPLLSIVPLNQMWVDANFKEVDISSIRIGQPVQMTADAYGGDIVYSGEVVGIAGGSGAVFSPLPPQNATGNWIKIVQRIPVRISINPEQLRRYPLRLGLSMDVNIDVREKDGRRVPLFSPEKAVYKTTIFEEQIDGVELIIEEVFEENLVSNLSLSDEVCRLVEYGK